MTQKIEKLEMPEEEEKYIWRDPLLAALFGACIVGFILIWVVVHPLQTQLSDYQREKPPQILDDFPAFWSKTCINYQPEGYLLFDIDLWNGFVRCEYKIIWEESNDHCWIVFEQLPNNELMRKFGTCLPKKEG